VREVADVLRVVARLDDDPVDVQSSRWIVFDAPRPFSVVRVSM